MTATRRLEEAPARRPPRPEPQPRPSSGHQRRPSPNLRVIESTPAARAASVSRARLAVIAGIALIVISLFGAVVAHVVLAQDQFQLEQLQRDSATRQAEYDRLRLQVAELESPQRIVATAQERLGMVVPAGVTYLAPTPDAGATARGVADPRSDSPPSSSWVTVKSHLAAG